MNIRPTSCSLCGQDMEDSYAPFFGYCEVQNNICVECLSGVLLAHQRGDHLGCSLSKYPKTFSGRAYVLEVWEEYKEGKTAPYISKTG